MKERPANLNRFPGVNICIYKQVFVIMISKDFEGRLSVAQQAFHLRV